MMGGIYVRGEIKSDGWIDVFNNWLDRESIGDGAYIYHLQAPGQGYLVHLVIRLGEKFLVALLSPFIWTYRKMPFDPFCRIWCWLFGHDTGYSRRGRCETCNQKNKGRI